MINFFVSEMNKPQLFCVPSSWKSRQRWVGRNTYSPLTDIGPDTGPQSQLDDFRQVVLFLA